MNLSRRSRKGSSSGGPAVLNILFFRHYSIKWFMFIGTILLIVFLFPRGLSFQYADYKVGSVMDREIIAPFDFPILKGNEELSREREQVQVNILPYFEEIKEVPQQSLDNIRQFFSNLENLNQLRKALFQSEQNAQINQPDSIQNKQVLLLRSRLDSAFKHIYSMHGVNVKEARWQFLIDSENKSLRLFEKHITEIIKDFYALGIIDQKKSDLGSAENQITIMSRNGELLQNLNNLYDLEEAKSEASGKVQKLYSLQSDSAAVGYEILLFALKPNIRYNERISQQLKTDAINRVPLSKGFVLKNQRIVDNHEIVTAEIYTKIQSLRAAISERTKTQGGYHALLPYFGKVLLVTILLSLLILYIYLSRRKIFENNTKMAPILVVIVLEIIFTYLIVQHAHLSEYLIPTTIASMLLVIIFDTSVAFIGTIIMALLIGGFLGNEYAISIVSMFTGVISTLTVKKVRHRSQFFKAIPVIAGAYLISVIAMGLVRYIPIENSIILFLKYCIPNSIASPILSLGLLYIFETGFGFATDTRLLELSDMNHPLLRALAVKAPGTYHHSIIMGNIAEAAAESIGANSLLTRVGTYYHDIGKISKAEYFTENQISIKNPHEKLTPTMSCLIISNHVREGVDLAKKHRLPQDIINFITQHHGTSRISFFYEKALEQTEARLIHEEDYRYPGPIPQTKEAGILMLADSIEAASRSLKNPSITRLREIVAGAIEKRLKEGELSDCELTLQDLGKINESFINSLIGLFHSRIEYPGKENEQNLAQEQKGIEKISSNKN